MFIEVKQSGQQTILLCIRKQISESIWSRRWTLGAYSWWWNPFCCPEATAEILIPLVPARANDRDGYIAEMQAAGFIVEEFVEMDVNEHCPYSASIFVRKPWPIAAGILRNTLFAVTQPVYTGWAKEEQSAVDYQSPFCNIFRIKIP